MSIRMRRAAPVRDTIGPMADALDILAGELYDLRCELERAERFCKPPQPPKGNPAVVTLSLADPAPGAPLSTQVSVRLELPCDKQNASACSKNIPEADAAKDGLQ